MNVFKAILKWIVIVFIVLPLTLLIFQELSSDLEKTNAGRFYSQLTEKVQVAIRSGQYDKATELLYRHDPEKIVLSGPDQNTIEKVLIEELKVIPVAETKANWRRYNILLTFKPENKRYIEREKFYRSKLNEAFFEVEQKQKQERLENTYQPSSQNTIVVIYIVLLVLAIWAIYSLRSKKNNNLTETKSIEKTEIKSEPELVRRIRPIKELKKDVVNNDDEVLATFTITTSYSEDYESSSNKSKGKWLGESESIKINGRMIKKGFFYYGGVLNSLNGYETEPSLVDDKRKASPAQPLNTVTPIYTDDSLGYWSSFESLSKKCRGVYLDWLASERNNLHMPIGYVFIYFYGLERRVIENKANTVISDDEFKSIFNEVARLNKCYWDNRSFRNYSSNFLELMYLLRPTLLKSKVEEIPETNNSLAFKFKLATTVKEMRPISGPLAIEWLRNTQEYSLRIPARRCEDEFSKLFMLKYVKKFGEGIIVKPNKTRLTLSYYAASSTIHSVEIDINDLPDPSILKGPITKLIPLAESCTEDLNAYSRYLGKADTSKDDIAALMLLPDELTEMATSPVIKSFKSWATNIISAQDGITSVKEFWSILGLPVPNSINKKENDLIINLAAKTDIGIAPDARFHHAKLKIDDNVVLFSPSHGNSFDPSKSFNQVGLAIRLGSMVAKTDGHLHTKEQIALEKFIEKQEQLTQIEKRSLYAYLKWRFQSPASNAGLKTRIEKLNANEIETIKRFIIAIALVDGSVHTSEIKQIEKLYANLGLDKSTVSSDIHHLASSKTYLSENTQKLADANTAFKLDEAILAMHENDTNDAKSMLGSIFTEVDESDVTTVNFPLVEPKEHPLDASHFALYQKLCEKERWERDEVHNLCKDYKLMVDGAIEIINDWSYEEVDAPVLDDDGEIYVDFEIVEELKER